MTKIEDQYEWVTLDDGRSIYKKKDEYKFKPKVYGQAPMVLFDSMEPTYHHGICRKIDSRKEWQEADQLTGSTTITPKEFKELQERRPAIAAAKEREMKEDRRKASIEATRAFKENKTEFYGKLKHRAEQQEKQAKEAGLNKLIKENI